MCGSDKSATLQSDYREGFPNRSVEVVVVVGAARSFMLIKYSFQLVPSLTHYEANGTDLCYELHSKIFHIRLRNFLSLLSID